MLSREFKHLRGSFDKRKDLESIPTAENMGVVGNVIDIKTAEKAEKTETQRPATTYYKKKLGKITRNLADNPSYGGEMHGWDVLHERTDRLEDFLL